MSTKREAAHDAVRRGFRTFPIAPDSKVPLLKENWREIASLDHEQIDKWWTDCPDANIGGVTDDKLVFDIDPRNGGKTTLEFLMLLHDFPKTARSETAGGGDHLIYQMPVGESVKGGTHRAGQGIDVKARGGYILLPGSTIGEKQYRWANDREIAFPPGWAVDMCAAARERTNAAGRRIVEEDDQARELAEQWLEQRAPTAQHGEIDDTTYKVAARLYDFGCSYETVHELVSEWNETHCFPRGDTERLETVCESAGRNRDNAIGAKHPQAPGFEAVEIDESLAPAAVDPADVVASLPKGRLYAIRADEGSRVALERRGEPLIEDVINCGTMSVLVGKGGGGKTFLAMDWAYHIAKGKPWAGRDVKQGAVVYLAAEAGNMILSRLKALETRYGPLGDAPLYVIPCPANFSRSTEDIKAIEALIRDVETTSGQKVELFVVDTLARVMTGDENSAKDMGAIIESVDYIRQKINCHVMLIHHPNKAGTSARGSGNVFGGCDTEMWVEDKVLSFTKQRDGALGKDIKFALPPITIGLDPKGRPVVSCTVRVSGDGQPDAPSELTGRIRDAWDTLDAALKDAGKTEFDMAFLRRVPFRHSSDNGPSRVTLIGWMSELSESGYLKKDKRGQWVVIDVGNVGNLSD